MVELGSNEAHRGDQALVTAVLHRILHVPRIFFISQERHSATAAITREVREDGSVTILRSSFLVRHKV